jgi:hypothetical protein
MAYCNWNRFPIGQAGSFTGAELACRGAGDALVPAHIWQLSRSSSSYASLAADIMKFTNESLVLPSYEINNIAASTVAQHTTKSFHMGSKLYITWSQAAKAWTYSVLLVSRKLEDAKRNWNAHEWNILWMLTQRHIRKHDLIHKFGCFLLL